MAKPRTPNQKKRYKALNRRLAKYISIVQNIYDSLAKESANIVVSGTDYKAQQEKPFSFKDYPQTRNKVNDLIRRFSEEMQTVIYMGASEEWKQSNLAQDLLTDDVLSAYGVKHGDKKYDIYYEQNNDALKAFLKRKDNGLTLSQKIWKQSDNFKQELEYAISSGIEKGQSAITLSKKISKYLHDFPSLQADYKKKYGTATECHDCEYRSIRLARSEINMAYREAEQTRWQQMDFIKGYEIKLSHSHPKKDICDELAGIYPKWFKWTGWHPNDLCYVIPIVMTDDEWYSGKGKEITELPQNYKDWCVANSNRILEASERGTLPYFIKNNYQVTINAINSAEVPPSAISPKDIDYLVSHGYIAKEGADTVKKILLSDSVEAAQKRIENLFAKPTALTVKEVAEKYAGRNPEIKILLSSIDRLTGIDGIGKLKTIDRLKDLCAKETIKDLASWDYLNGLTYKGISKNFILSPKHTRTTKNGITVEIPETRVDIIIFRDSYGKEFAYPLGAHKGMFNASVASKIIQEYPPYFRRGIKRISFLDQANPYDVYWKIEYDNPNHVSMASDGGRINFYMTPEDKESFKDYLAHEGGHILDGDNKHLISSAKGWLDAVAADDEWYAEHGIKRIIRISKYAKTNNSEDFAECMKAYLTDHDYFKSNFPNRAAFIRKMAQKYSKS